MAWIRITGVAAVTVAVTDVPAPGNREHSTRLDRRAWLLSSLVLMPLALASQPIRLPVTLVQSNPVTTIAVGDLKVLGSVEFVLQPFNPPKDFQGVLGANFFANHLVCLDYAHREVRVSL